MWATEYCLHFISYIDGAYTLIPISRANDSARITLRIPRGSSLPPIVIQPFSSHICPIIICLGVILTRGKGHCRLAQLCIYMVTLYGGLRKVVVVANSKRLSAADNVARDALDGRCVHYLSLETSDQNVNIWDPSHRQSVHWT